MPAPFEPALWKNLYAKNYPEVQRLIETHPDLINAIDEDTEYNLPISLIEVAMNPREIESSELLAHVLTHPTMNWGYASSDQTAAQFILDAALVDGDFSLIESLKDVSGFILSNNKLTYVLAADLLKHAEKIHNEKIQRGRPQSQIDGALKQVQTCKALLTLIRDITILHAINTDNADLFERMERAGGQPLEDLDDLDDLGQNQIPSLLFGIHQPNPKLRAWHKAVVDRKTANRDKEVEKLTARFEQHTMFQEQVANINEKHDARTIAILAEAGAARQKRIDAALAKMS
ncbi:hypothetical protein [Legionella sp.]|uniref:hypothetical protein n=1 Tax=Legionella sp. TaxID=459 RepID=UPI003C8A8B64